MTNYRQILVALAMVLWAEEVKCAPFLQGVKITRDLNIDFKPFQFKPFTFLREKWGPLGAFGKKIGIAKRDVDEMIITPPPPVGTIIGPAFARPAPVEEVTPDNPPPPVIIPSVPVMTGSTPSVISNEIFQDISPVNRIGQDFIGNSNRITGLNTDSRVQPVNPIINPPPIVDNMPRRINLLVPPVAPPAAAVPATQPQPETISGRGTIARLFGEFILQLFSRIVSNARSSFGQLSARVQ